MYPHTLQTFLRKSPFLFFDVHVLKILLWGNIFGSTVNNTTVSFWALSTSGGFAPTISLFFLLYWISIPVKGKTVLSKNTKCLLEPLLMSGFFFLFSCSFWNWISTQVTVKLFCQQQRRYHWKLSRDVVKEIGHVCHPQDLGDPFGRFPWCEWKGTHTQIHRENERDRGREERDERERIQRGRERGVRETKREKGGEKEPEREGEAERDQERERKREGERQRERGKQRVALHITVDKTQTQEFRSLSFPADPDPITRAIESMAPMAQVQQRRSVCLFTKNRSSRPT